jgi:hypothetical protein
MTRATPRLAWMIPLLVAGTARKTVSLLTKVHVADIDDETIRDADSNSKIRIAIGIRLHNAEHKPVSHVRIRADWSGALFGQANCETDPEGYCQVTSKTIPNENGIQVELKIKALEGPDIEYDNAANHDPDRDSDGTQIKIVR